MTDTSSQRPVRRWVQRWGGWVVAPALGIVIASVVAIAATPDLAADLGGYPIWLRIGIPIVAALSGAVAVLYRTSRQDTRAFLTSLQELSERERAAHQKETAEERATHERSVQMLLDRIDRRDEVMVRQTQILADLLGRRGG